MSQEYNRFSVGNWTLQQQVTTGNFVFYLVELSLCFLTISVNVAFFVVVRQAELLHRNLRTILMATSVANTIYGISRYLITVPLITTYLYDVEISTVTYCRVAKSIHHLVVGIPAFVFFIVILERTLATYFYKSYEKTGPNRWGYWLAGFQWSLGLFIVTINQIDVAGKPRPYSRLPCQMEYTTSRCLYLTISLYIVANSIGFFMFSKIRHFNKTLYKQRSWRLRTLSETFQVAENVKSIKILIPLLIVSLVSNLLSIILIGLQATMYLLVRETAEDQRAELTKQLSIKILGRGSEASQVYDLTSAITRIVFCVYTIFSHPVLRKKWCQIFWAHKIRPHQEEVVKFTILEETQHHFDSLKLLWEQKMEEK